METSSEVHRFGLDVIIDVLGGLGPDGGIIWRIFSYYVGKAQIGVGSGSGVVVVLAVMLLELFVAATDLAITLGTWVEIGFFWYRRSSARWKFVEWVEWMCWIRAARAHVS